jgi:hypothetical protein
MGPTTDAFSRAATFGTSRRWSLHPCCPSHSLVCAPGGSLICTFLGIGTGNTFVCRSLCALGLPTWAIQIGWVNFSRRSHYRLFLRGWPRQGLPRRSGSVQVEAWPLLPFSLAPPPDGVASSPLAVTLRSFLLGVRKHTGMSMFGGMCSSKSWMRQSTRRCR